jgi:hypothetical protein
MIRTYAINLTGTDMYWRGGYINGWWVKPEKDKIGLTLYDTVDHVRRVQMQIVTQMTRMLLLPPETTGYRLRNEKELINKLQFPQPFTPDSVRIVVLEMSVVDVLPTPVKKRKSK